MSEKCEAHAVKSLWMKEEKNDVSVTVSGSMG
jgi:hypothetical protein